MTLSPCSLITFQQTDMLTTLIPPLSWRLCPWIK